MIFKEQGAGLENKARSLTIWSHVASRKQVWQEMHIFTWESSAGIRRWQRLYGEKAALLL